MAFFTGSKLLTSTSLANASFDGLNNLLMKPSINGYSKNLFSKFFYHQARQKTIISFSLLSDSLATSDKFLFLEFLANIFFKKTLQLDYVMFVFSLCFHWLELITQKILFCIGLISRDIYFFAYVIPPCFNIIFRQKKKKMFNNIRF